MIRTLDFTRNGRIKKDDEKDSLHKTMKNFTLTRLSPFLLPFLLTSSLLSGCQQLSRQPLPRVDNATREARQWQLKKLQQWQIKGKLLFKSPQKKNSLSLYWSQHLTQSELRLNTFLGISVLKMISDQHSATLHADGKTVTSAHPQQLLQQTTGITLPLRELSQWIKGVGKIEDPQQVLVWDAFNRLKQIRLLDSQFQPWQVDYLGYGHHDSDGQSYQLPKKIRLSGNDIQITITINDWKLTRAN